MLNIKHFAVIDSTNDEASRIVDAAQNNNTLHTLHKTIITADKQTNGHGRLSRTFDSPLGGLYFSLIWLNEAGSTKTGTSIFNPTYTKNARGNINIDFITSTAAVCVAQSLIERGFNARIKWVNDILILDKKDVAKSTLDNQKNSLTKYPNQQICCDEKSFQYTVFGSYKKVAGILTKGILSQDNKLLGAIIGIGVDIFDDTLLTDITNKMIFALENGDTSNIIKKYKELSILIGKTVLVHPIIDSGNSYIAKVIDITNNAHLVVQDEHGIIKELSSGEVTLHSTT